MAKYGFMKMSLTQRDAVKYRLNFREREMYRTLNKLFYSLLILKAINRDTFENAYIVSNNAFKAYINNINNYGKHYESN